MINWGVIGACGIADRRTIPEGITKAKNAKLSAVMDIAQDKVQAVAEKYGVKYYTREEELLNDRNIDAVYIATPTNIHCKQVVMAAQRGKHILCEKPMAMSVSECNKMIEACKKNKVKLALGYMMRFHVYHQKAKEIVSSGALGKIVMGRAQLSCWYPPIKGAWRQDIKVGGGGSLIDMGSHCIDLLEMIMGKVKEVSCFTNSLINKYSVEDTALMSVKFESGAVGLVDNHFNIPDLSSKNVLEIYGQKGSILAKGTVGQMSNGAMITYIEKDGKGYDAQQHRMSAHEENIELEPRNIYQSQIEHFCEAIEKNRNPLISGEDGLWNLKIMLAAYKSAKTGKVVKLVRG
ncbi:MAG: hypothetical protein A3J83_02095 [Elusimicrobia bacterium RIFOXYA2_FULL_40_6]|nr:MAG: hypothetical protein A3J83_02095 [Elusimicrobia bacterium RIFOXYA2_FULL_40_6]